MERSLERVKDALKGDDVARLKRAAEELHIAQSALSRQVQKLEDELRLALFERHARGVRLTSAGDIFLRHAQSNLQQVERVRSELDALKGLKRGTVDWTMPSALYPGLKWVTLATVAIAAVAAWLIARVRAILRT